MSKEIIKSSNETNVMRRSEVKKAKSRLSTEVPEADNVRFVALGGLEEIGRNMMFLEYKDEILVVDAGIQFPSEETPGIDYIIPNTSYLELVKDRIQGLIITHGHQDHIGAIPYILDKLGNPVIYTTKFTKEMIMSMVEEEPSCPNPKFDLVESGDSRKISKNFTANFFEVSHNVPEGVGFLLDTPVGNIVHPGEFKLDRDKDGNAKNLEIWEKLGEKDIHTLMLDSTASGVPGKSVSEETVKEELTKLFEKAEGRIIVGTFSSLIDRLSEIIDIAEEMGKVVAISGYSMKQNIEIAKRLGFIDTEKGTLIPMEEIHKYDDDKVMVLCTGAQGEERASLMRMARREHRNIDLKESDTIIFSSSVVPGNEMSVQNLKDDLARQGVTIYDYNMLDIHSSGHAPQEDLKTVMELVKPKNFLPIHGYYFMRWKNAQLAKETLGISQDNIILTDNGRVVELKRDSVEVTDETVPSSYVLVDGAGVGDIGEVVLRDRKVLSESGMVVIIATISKKDSKILKSPDIISRGFVYLRENKDLLNDIRDKIRKIIRGISKGGSLDIDYTKSAIRKQVGRFLNRRTDRSPMVLPVIIEV
ncbi:MAG: ribonuclease J [Candidatus Magasanikbacteria bacterium]